MVSLQANGGAEVIKEQVNKIMLDMLKNHKPDVDSEESPMQWMMDISINGVLFDLGLTSL